MEISRKRMKATEGSEKNAGVDEAGMENEEMAAAGLEETTPACSEEMDSDIQRILEKIDIFTQQVSEMLESGKQMFKDLSTEFEERIILTHKEQMEKWQDEIKDLRMIDATNESSRVLLHNAQLHLLHTVPENDADR